MRRSSLLLPAAMVVIFSACDIVASKKSTPANISVPDLADVRVTDSFWAPKIELNRVATIPYAFIKCEETGRIDNFAVAGGLMKGTYKGERYNDSDVFKIIEGACYSLINTPDPKLRQYVDSLVVLIGAAQEDDGYLYTTRTCDPVNMAPGAGIERWADERVSHELYNVGHMYEAAVAHYKATGSDAFLNIALKNAALVSMEFGWGKREIAPGHQEIEIGLIKLFHATGDMTWLDLAQFFIDVRGKQGDYVRHPEGSRFEVYNDSVYLQMHKPVLEQAEAVGHSVRGAYMYSAMADVSEATGDERYLEASKKIWEDVIRGKIYITGGIGSKEYGEAFGEPYELPNMTAYTETCASVANVFWNQRLFKATGESKYLDVLERTLYNGLISGIGSDGCHFFYPNPLESDGTFERAGWFDCSCCPSNVARFLPALGQYIYSYFDEGVSVNLFIGSVAKLKTAVGDIIIEQNTEFPWNGDISLKIDPSYANCPFKLKIRIPSWTGSEPFAGGLYRYTTSAKGHIAISVNGTEAAFIIEEGFAVLDRKWNKGDMVAVTLPMQPRLIAARDEVKADSGRLALGVGPVIYCLEEIDNGKVRDVRIDPSEDVEILFDVDRNSGYLEFMGVLPDGDEKRVKAVPYYTWANRGRGEMIVWMKKK